MLEHAWNDRFIRIPLRWVWGCLYRVFGAYRYRWIDNPRGYWKREAVILMYRIRTSIVR